MTLGQHKSTMGTSSAWHRTHYNHMPGEASRAGPKTSKHGITSSPLSLSPALLVHRRPACLAALPHMTSLHAAMHPTCKQLPTGASAWCRPVRACQALVCELAAWAGACTLVGACATGTAVAHLESKAGDSNASMSTVELQARCGTVQGDMLLHGCAGAGKLGAGTAQSLPGTVKHHTRLPTTGRHTHLVSSKPKLCTLTLPYP